LSLRGFTRLTDLPLNALLSENAIRRRLLFQLKQNHYDELDLVVPLPNDLRCPVTNSAHWYSFSEIFVQREYESALNAMPLPVRWIDLGCHAGYFSLYVAMRANRAELDRLEALLIDADPRVAVGVNKLISLNSTISFAFRNGLVGDGAGMRDFHLGPVMSSAATTTASANSGETVSTEIISQSEIMQGLPPPYDLIKVDIEGGEFEFMAHYKDLIAATKYLLLEWHSWGTEGGGAQKVIGLAADLGFTLLSEATPSHDVILDGKAEQCGVLLFAGP
jgi:FkbM family methyltransferase